MGLEIHPLSIGIPAAGERPPLPAVCAATGAPLDDHEPASTLRLRSRRPVPWWAWAAMALVLVGLGPAATRLGWWLALPGLVAALAVPVVAGWGATVEVPVTAAAGAAYRRATRLYLLVAVGGLVAVIVAVAVGAARGGIVLPVAGALGLTLVAMAVAALVTRDAPRLRAAQQGEVVMVEGIDAAFVKACRQLPGS